MSAIVHYLGLLLFQPGTPLYQAATTGTGALGGQAWADMVWQVIAIWVPLIAFAGILCYALIREYRRQAVTSTRPV